MSDGTCSTTRLDARRAGGGDVAVEAAGAEARLDRLRRREQQGVRAGAVAVGDDRHAGVRLRGRACASSSAGSSSGVSPGTSSTRSKPAASAWRMPIMRRGGLAGLVAVVQQRHAVAAGGRLGHVVGGDDHDLRRGPRPRRSEASTSENIACASAWRDAAAERVRSRCLAAPKLLMGRIAIVRIGASTGVATVARRDAGTAYAARIASANSRVVAATRRARRGRVHQRVGHEARQTVGRSSATTPSIRPS